MYRPYIHALIRAIESQQVKQLLLDGMPGAGKSVVMAALAHWARQAGWVVRAASLHSCQSEVKTCFYMQMYTAPWVTILTTSMPA